ncbi:MAG TPA: DUF6328 family protein [Sporichthya sp.]|nr:DUF6328 family protein [Sporichthya sp.]
MVDAEDRSPPREESPAQKIDRNWIELLQEVRVVQTGVQLLTGFLLTLPFQERFRELSDASQRLYLVAVGLSVASTACLVTPVAMHRLLFRHGARPLLVESAQRFALAGLALLAGAIVAVLTLIFGIVVSRGVGIIVGAISTATFLILWLAIPLVLKRQLRVRSPGSP